MSETRICHSLRRWIRNTGVIGEKLDHVCFAARRSLRRARQSLDLGHGEWIDDLGAGSTQLRQCFLEIGDDPRVGDVWPENLPQHT